MMVSHRHRFVYFRPPRTCTGSTGKMLGRTYGAKGVPGHCAHASSWSPEYADYLTFITVRHPYPRMVSLWRLLVKQEKPKLGPWFTKFYLDHKDGQRISFREFVLHPANLGELHRRSCRGYLEPFGYKVDHVLHYDTLREDLGKLPFIRQPIVFPKQRLHASVLGRPWWEVYEGDQEVIEGVQWAWGVDFDEFDYPRDFDEAKVRYETVRKRA